MSTQRYPQGIRAPRFFDPLEATDFQRIEHAASLKGLLKPFKGKEALLTFAGESEAARDALIQRAQRLLAQATAYPFSMLPVALTQQSTAAGTAFLRWRNADRSAMGVALWATLIEDPATPLQMLDELFALEIERVALNMQVSLTHTLARQARECAQKMTYAESIYRRRAPLS
jgi:hypothetical protein